MNSAGLIRYFPELNHQKVRQFEILGKLYPDWNEKINVISRKDIDNLYERHILHSLSIARIKEFKPRTSILDAGTGGGFPGIPLAIFFPEVNFHLIDSTAKKLVVVEKIISETGLENVTFEHCRLENHHSTYNFIVSRAVASLNQMTCWVGKNLKTADPEETNGGILYLKGGEIEEEIKYLKNWNKKIYPLSEYFQEPFFQTKYLIHLF